MVEVAVLEVHLIASVGLEGLILQLLIVHELRFVYDDMVERQTIAGTLTVLGDNLADAAIVEADAVLPVLRGEDRILPLQSLPWFLANGIMDISLISPSLPVYQERW